MGFVRFAEFNEFLSVHERFQRIDSEFIITACVRSTTGGYVFTGVCLSTLWGGYPMVSGPLVSGPFWRVPLGLWSLVLSWGVGGNLVRPVAGVEGWYPWTGQGHHTDRTRGTPQSGGQATLQVVRLLRSHRKTFLWYGVFRLFSWMALNTERVLFDQEPDVARELFKRRVITRNECFNSKTIKYQQFTKVGPRSLFLGSWVCWSNRI